MESVPFTPTAKQIACGHSIDVAFGEGAAFSLPVAVRRDHAQYDAMFLYQMPLPETDATAPTSPRPFAWVLLDAFSGQVALTARCDLLDFMPAERYPLDCLLAMDRPKLPAAQKLAAWQDKLLETYEQLRLFVFEENLSRQQAGIVSDYKELFQKLSYPAHYPYYHGLSPAFFHWLRMPLPKEASGEALRPAPGLQTDSYQLLILENLQQLVRQFQDKIMVDSHKEQLFDNMHRELQDYKNDLLDTLTRSMERDSIQLIDQVEKAAELFRQKEPTPENYALLLTQLQGVETDLCDLLYRHGVEPYTQQELDVSRQKIVLTVPTDDPALDKTVATRLARGWEKEGKVIRPERISVYVTTPTERNVTQ